MKYAIKAKGFPKLVAKCIDAINEFCRAAVRNDFVIGQSEMVQFNFIESGGNDRELLENVLVQVVTLMKVHKVGVESIAVHEEPNGAWRIEVQGEKIVMGRKVFSVKVLELDEHSDGVAVVLELK